MPILYYLATPLPLVVMLAAVLALWRKRNVKGLARVLVGWLLLSAFGSWWFSYDAKRAAASGERIVDAGFVNSTNCILLGSIGIFVGLVAWRHAKSKISPKGQQ
jgi:hypothetical protein